MRATKRSATFSSEFAPEANDTAMRTKQVKGPCFDTDKAETGQQGLPSLDVQRAELSRQHVRALNSQFSSWVQAHIKNHPDELWEDGVRDYLAHASSIMEKFSDVVKWLRAHAEKGPGAESCSSDKKVSPQMQKNENSLSNEKTAFASASTGFTAPWSSGIFSKNQSAGGISGSPNSGSLLSNNPSSEMSSSIQSTGLFSNIQSPRLFSSSQSAGVVSNSQNLGSLASSQSAGLFSKSQSPGLSSNSQGADLFSNSKPPSLFSSNQTTGLSSNSQGADLFSNSKPPSLFSSNQTTGLSSISQGADLFSNSKPPSLFSSNQTTGLFSSSPSSGLFTFNSSSAGAFSSSEAPILFGGQSSVPNSNNASDDAEDDEFPKPSSPSVKKAEEEGVVVVHEVKCKLYVKPIDGADKHTWKDKGPGKLTIKCAEGISKGTKESNPTIIIRNDVGKVLLNALLYPGIKTNLQKNAVVAIFHVAADESGNGESIAARTFLIRTKTVEDRDRLATAIREYAPESS